MLIKYILIMKIIKLYLLMLISIKILQGVTLQSVFDNALPGNGYDKYMVLDQNVIYTGEIGVYEGNVFIEGNGAIVDLNQGLGLWVYAEQDFPASLHIEYLNIINGGYNGITFNGTSTGNISNCNFIQNEFGIQIMDEADVLINNSNFIHNNQYGVSMRGTTAYFEINYSNFWENNLGCAGYNENC